MVKKAVIIIFRTFVLEKLLTYKNKADMKFGQSHVQLRRRKQTDGSWYYWLHAVTFYNHTGLVADGTFPIEQSLNEEGMFVIDLKVKRDHSIKMMPYLSPVVHTIEIGAVPFGSEEGWFLVRTIVIGLSKDPNNQGGQTTHSSDSDDDDRPIGNDEF